MSALIPALLREAAPLAYLDPGSGSYLIQLLVAGALGAILAIRLSWDRIKGIFRRGDATEEPDHEQHDE